MRPKFSYLALISCLALWITPVYAQQYDGEVTGWLSGVTHKYNGDFTDDSWGAGVMGSLQYAPISRLGIELRAGLGEYRWKIGKNDLAAHPNYYGNDAQIGDNYPGTLTEIESANESRLSTVDLLVNYTLVDNIPAIPFISAGIGLVNFAPSTDAAHDALPNDIKGVYSTTCASIPLGGGVRIPFSYRTGIVIRGEYRFVFSQYLDDVNFNGSNDGITSVSLGFSYRFTNPPRHEHLLLPPHHHHCLHSKCPCAMHPDHMQSECPCRDQLGNDGSDGEHGSSPNDDESGADTIDRYHQKPAGATTSEPADSLSRTKKSSGNAGVAENMGADSAKSTSPNNQSRTNQTDSLRGANVPTPPCEAGTVQICTENGKRVCVTEVTKLGSERIQWEDAYVYEPSNPSHKQTLRNAGNPSPCFDLVIRQTPGSYYGCVDCCFEQQVVGSKTVYMVIGSSRIVKGQGIFTPEPSPECAADNTSVNK